MCDLYARGGPLMPEQRLQKTRDAYTAPESFPLTLTEQQRGLLVTVGTLIDRGGEMFIVESISEDNREVRVVRWTPERRR